jgi:hypothetical protein
MAHTRDRGKGDQTHEQCVFNQVLAFFAVRQVLQLQIKLQKETVHVFPPVLRFRALPVRADWGKRENRWCVRRDPGVPFQP